MDTVMFNLMLDNISQEELKELFELIKESI